MLVITRLPLPSIKFCYIKFYTHTNSFVLTSESLEAPTSEGGPASGTTVSWTSGSYFKMCRENGQRQSLVSRQKATSQNQGCMYNKLRQIPHPYVYSTYQVYLSLSITMMLLFLRRQSLVCEVEGSNHSFCIHFFIFQFPLN